jgi:hypothetical protein
VENYSIIAFPNAHDMVFANHPYPDSLIGTLYYVLTLCSVYQKESRF